MLMDVSRSLFLLIDAQEKLIPHVCNDKMLVENCRWLLQVAEKMDVPILASEQYPQGLGATVPELKSLLSPQVVSEKLHFSCVEDSNCLHQLMSTAREQIIIAGIEAHVCVLQTAMGLLHLDKQVFVVADAISSRDANDYEMAIARMRAAGVQIVTKEMVLFEWLHQAGTDKFRQMSKAFLQ